MSTRSQRAIRKTKSLCPRCGKPGPHFVPPSFGDIGFYSCDPPADIRNHSRINLDEARS